MMMLADRALALLHEWVQSESLRKHCYAVSGRCGTSPKCKTRTRIYGKPWVCCTIWITNGTESGAKPAEGHPFVGVATLREQAWSEEVCRAILSHADYAGVTRETPLERTLYAVDELSGFVMAVARVRPSKSIQEVDVAAVKKKMKDKAFARAVNRDDIVRGAAELGMPLDDVIGGVIAALKADAERLQLAGNAS